MTLDEFKKVTPESFEKLGAAEREAAIEFHDEFVRVWHGQCRRCGAQLSGTLVEIRKHVCHPE